MSRRKKPTESNSDAPFPSRLRKLMEETKTTQEDLAQLLGVQRQTVGLYSWGASLPDIAGLQKIAEHFNVSADYLLGMAESKTRIPSLQQAIQYTGLTEKAVENLSNVLNDPMGALTLIKPAVDCLLSSSEFESFADALATFFFGFQYKVGERDGSSSWRGLAKDDKAFFEQLIQPAMLVRVQTILVEIKKRTAYCFWGNDKEASHGDDKAEL